MLSSNNGGADPNTLVADQFRPLQGYSDLNLATNNGYSNYNSLQVTWLRTKGRYTISMNYTFGKALGIVEGANDNLVDPFHLDENYGVLPSNRTHIFNAAYSIELGNPSKNALTGAFVNGWQVSGLTQLQSGPNLTGYQNQNFAMNLNSAKIAGTNFNISNTSLLGTPNIQLNPILTCDPSSGVSGQQYINANCFAAPSQVGENGPTILPAIYGPGYFNFDLGIWKTFKITEAKTFQFRFDGYNILNHPLWSFNGGNLNLGFDPTTLEVNTPNFGKTTDKQGHRIVMFGFRFMF